jgi:opacity protein-like surface antigen
MNKLFLALCLTVFTSVFAFAQTTAADDYNKVEGFIGYSNNQVDTGISDDDNDLQDFFGDREGFHGVNGSVTANVNRFVGIKGDVSGHFKGYEFDVPRVGTGSTTDRFKVDASVYNFLGGVQIKDNAKDGSRFRPFAHALVGVAHARAKVDSSFFTSSFCSQAGVDCRADFSESETGFAAAIGGGIDIKATDRLSIRAIQVDYNPNRINGTTQNNFRFGFGLVFH